VKQGVDSRNELTHSEKTDQLFVKITMKADAGNRKPLQVRVAVQPPEVAKTATEPSPTPLQNFRNIRWVAATSIFPVELPMAGGLSFRHAMPSWFL